MNLPRAAAVPALGSTRRAILLFSNFLLIILGYYQIKPASRSLFIEYWGADKFPYIYIATAVALGALIGYYHRLVARYSRLAVVLATLALSAMLLVVFRLLLPHGSAAAAAVFYVFVDIFSVVLVEQFWSLANTIYTTEAGKRWYGFVSTGGLLGGAIGSGVANQLLSRAGLATEDLLLAAAAILVVLFVLNLIMGRLGVYTEVGGRRGPEVDAGGWRVLAANRYLLLIAAMVLISQLVETVSEFQFNKLLEVEYPDKDPRTAYSSAFLLVLNVVAIAVNLAVTPLVHRYLGVMSGLAVQPLLAGIFSMVFIGQPTLFVASMLKIADRGMSYSINRASKEILYIPIDPVLTYQAKAWIDMFGYRLFKVLGSLLILVMTQWFALGLGLTHLSMLTLGVCGAWLLILMELAPRYRTVLLKAA